MELDVDIGDWVLQARTAAKLTQEELAHLVGLGGKANISAYEKGRTQPPFETMMKISKECGYPLPYQNGYNNIGLQENHNTGSGIQNNINGVQNNNFLSEQDDPNYTMPDDSMNPIIPKDSKLWINNDKQIQDGKTYLLEWGGLSLIRRLYRKPNNQIRLVAANPEYGEDTAPIEDIQINGRILKWFVTD